jgi:hypothetical protein
MDDIVTRMRTMDVDEYSDVLGVFSDAADEIERLRKELRHAHVMVQYLNDVLADFEERTND